MSSSYVNQAVAAAQGVIASIAATPTFTGTVIAPAATIAGAISGGSLTVSGSSVPFVYNASGVLQPNSKIVTGTGTLPGTVSNNFVVNLTGAAQFTSGSSYVVMITEQADAPSFRPYNIWADTQTSNTFIIQCDNNSVNIPVAWVAIGN